MAIGLGEIAAAGGGAYIIDETFDEAQAALQAGATEGAAALTDIQQPFVDFGTEAIPGYQGLGEFEFSYDDYLASENYQWLMDEEMRGVQRSQAAQKMLQSGGTLAALQARGAEVAGAQYGAEYERQLTGYGANVDYYGGAIETGAEVGMNLGNTLAEISVGTGTNLANLAQAEGGAYAELYGSLVKQADTSITNIAGGGADSTTGATASPTAPATTGGVVDSLISQATGGNLSLAQISELVPNISSLSELDLAGNLVALWQSQGVGDNFGSFLDNVFGYGATSSTSLDILENFNADLLNIGTENIFGTDIFDYEAGAGLLSPEEFQATIGDEGFWNTVQTGLGDAWDATGGAVYDWASDFF